MDNITFLEFEDLSKLDVLNTYGTLCSTTDFNILLGGNIHKGLYTSDGINLYNRATIYYTKTDDYEDADLIILNTCAIRENAHNKTFGFL